MKAQVNKTHYEYENYMNIARWNSYFCQIDETMKCDGKEVLYIGSEDRVVVDTLEKYGKDVKTLDLAEDLKPDFLGSVTEIDKVLKGETFDVVVCSQVLEHIPFEMFESTISKMEKVVKEKLILSLPNRNKYARVMISGMGERMIKRRRRSEEVWDINNQGKGEHYWEIDAKGCATRKEVEQILEKYFKLEKFFIPFNNTYHMFFILRKK